MSENTDRLLEVGGRPGTEGFFRWVWERQSVWHRRTVLLEPAPWTDDAILARNRYCNTQRELDRGTAYLLRKLPEWRRHFETHGGGGGAVDRALAYNTCLYRVHNNWDAWHGHVVALNDGDAYDERLWREDLENAIASLNAAADAGEKTGPTGWTACYWSRGEAMRRFARDFNAREAGVGWPALAASIELAVDSCGGSLEPVYRRLLKFGGMGTLVAFQAALDLRYVFPRLSDDVWVSVIKTRERALGTLSGSGGGAELVRPGQDPLRTMQELAEHQDVFFDALGLDWAAVAWAGKPRLSLADVEHSLCEYRKWNNARLGRGKQRRL